MARTSWPSPPTRTKRGPVLAAATCDNARWAGVWSSSLTTWPNNEFRLLAMILNTGKVGPVDNFCVSDKVMPAYPEDHTLGTHVDDKPIYRYNTLDIAPIRVAFSSPQKRSGMARVLKG